MSASICRTCVGIRIGYDYMDIGIEENEYDDKVLLVDSFSEFSVVDYDDVFSQRRRVCDRISECLECELD